MEALKEEVDDYFSQVFPTVLISAKSFESYLNLSWNNPEEFEGAFDKKTKEFHKENPDVGDIGVQEYANLRALDVLWKPFQYKTATKRQGDVDVELKDDLTSDKIREMVKKAKLGADDKPITAEELLKCKSATLRMELSDFLEALIKAQIFYNRISYHPGPQQSSLSSSANILTELTEPKSLVERYFGSLEIHKSQLDIGTYEELKDDAGFTSYKIFVNFFRLMFSPENISQTEDYAEIRENEEFTGLVKLFENNASVDNVASLTENVLKAYESNSTDKGALYNVKMTAESQAIRGDFKVQVKSKVGDESDIITNPLLIELKNSKNLSGEFDHALTYGEVSLTPIIMVSNMDIAYIIKLPLEELIRGERKYTKCGIYGPIDLRTTPASLLVSVLVFEGMIDYRDKLQKYPDLQDIVVRSTRLKKNISLSSYLVTLGAPESTGKRKRDIEREKISMEAFNVCLGLGLKGSDDCDQEIISKLVPQIKERSQRLIGSPEFSIGGSDDNYKRPVEPVVLNTEDFFAEEIVKGENWYSNNLATTFVVCQKPGSQITSLKDSESYIMKVFDPVKLNCFKDDDILFSHVETDLDGFPHKVFCLISECFLREVSAYLLLFQKLGSSYSNYVPKLKSYGFLENKGIREASTTREKLYNPYITDSSGNDVLNQQGGFVLLEKLENTKDECLELPEKERIEVTKEGIRALERIHEAGIIHGDIKRDNVIVTKTGNQLVVKIIDFGHSLKSKTNQSEDKEPKRGKKRKRVVSDSEGGSEDVSVKDGEFMKSDEMEELETVLIRMLDLPDGCLKS